MGCAMKPAAQPPCPCDSGRGFAGCCGPYLGGQAVAPTACALMRSRYTAFALRDETYLLATWHSSTRPAALGLLDDTTKWIALQVKRFEVTGTNEANGADTAIVEFIARYKLNGRAHRIHEVSRFVREAGRWYYVAAVTPPV